MRALALSRVIVMRPKLWMGRHRAVARAVTAE
jgi:hypothetical protein